ncbi:hypothetical protein KH5_16350 [Urechidicola sp. KH5]
MKKLILILCLIVIHQLNAQFEITEQVFDKITKAPLYGATVYLDGSSVGTATDTNGTFKIYIDSKVNAQLVISFVGYKTYYIEPSEFNSLNTIYLEEKNNELDEVVLAKDIWSREKKERYFLSQFLGINEAAKHCIINNLKDVELIYNAELNTLMAFSDSPIYITNKHLGYKLQYNLIDFEITFKNSYPNNLLIIHKVYYAGTSFFSELKSKPKKKYVKNRTETYNGSIMHFMRSLAAEKLHENSFELYHKSFKTNPSFHISVTNMKNTNTKNIVFKSENLSVLYDRQEQSEILLSNPSYNTISIDHYGNYSPTTTLLFGGSFGQKRISSLLPLDYNMN